MRPSWPRPPPSRSLGELRTALVTMVTVNSLAKPGCWSCPVSGWPQCLLQLADTTDSLTPKGGCTGYGRSQGGAGGHSRDLPVGSTSNLQSLVLSLLLCEMWHSKQVSHIYAQLIIINHGLKPRGSGVCSTHEGPWPGTAMGSKLWDTGEKLSDH